MNTLPLLTNIRRIVAWLVLYSWFIGAEIPAILACPFCPALETTLAEQREAADWCLVGVAQATTHQSEQQFSINQSIKQPVAATLPREVKLTLTMPMPVNQLAILWGTGQSPQLIWTAQPASEALLVYLARSPELRRTTTERLPYFAKYLEHADPTISSDALQEFAHADFVQVRQVVGVLTDDQLRDWLQSEQVAASQRGFYAMLLGLQTQLAQQAKPIAVEHVIPPQQVEVEMNCELLGKLAFTPANDFRRGQDGVYAGYLLAHGAPGFVRLRKELLEQADAAPGDLRHALTALRFYEEFGPRELRPNAIAAVEVLLPRPLVAASVITDLARWQHWSALPNVVAWYAKPTGDQVINRAVIGYLLSCPSATAATALAELRRQDPVGVAQHEAALQRVAGNGAKE